MVNNPSESTRSFGWFDELQVSFIYPLQIWESIRRQDFNQFYTLFRQSYIRDEDVITKLSAYMLRRLIEHHPISEGVYHHLVFDIISKSDLDRLKVLCDAQLGFPGDMYEMANNMLIQHNTRSRAQIVEMMRPFMTQETREDAASPSSHTNPRVNDEEDGIVVISDDDESVDFDFLQEADRILDSFFDNMESATIPQSGSSIRESGEDEYNWEVTASVRLRANRFADQPPVSRRSFYRVMSRILIPPPFTKLPEDGSYGKECKISTPTDCLICFDGVIDVGHELPCSSKHIFHKDCIETWLKKKQNCPLCRTKLPIAQ